MLYDRHRARERFVSVSACLPDTSSACVKYTAHNRTRACTHAPRNTVWGRPIRIWGFLCFLKKMGRTAQKDPIKASVRSAKIAHARTHQKTPFVGTTSSTPIELFVDASSPWSIAKNRDKNSDSIIRLDYVAVSLVKYSTTN